MIYSVRGKLTYLDPHVAVVECGGVGFNCQITMNTAKRMPAIGEEVFLYTMLNVREDAIEIYGFAEKEELNCYKLLTSISGVGPKAGNAILSVLSPEKVATAVVTGDFKALTAAQGVGPKVAQRIVLELKDKYKTFTPDVGVTSGVASVSGNAEAAVKALNVLGFSVSESSAVVAKLDSSLSVEVLVKEALKNLAK
ncbi:MAG: Holliday junction branch migration protein RuvA [Clostridia bacterium]|nr:Holliday junction branch migration protein RuvA [Clostridia bacterium]